MARNPGRGGAVTAITGTGRTLDAAVDAFLSVPRPDTTARTYAGTLERLADRLGRDRPLASVADEETAAAANAAKGKTLHQLRHSRLTHLGGRNVSAPLLMAISGHKQLSALQQYVRPGQAAVAKLMAGTGTDRRRR